MSEAKATGVLEKKLDSVLHWAVRVDPAEVRAKLAGMRSARPSAARHALAKSLYSRLAWKAAATGVAAGLPTNLAIAVPAAVVEAGKVLRWEVEAAATVALIYEPTFLDDPEALWELLVPLFGVGAASQALRELGMKGASQISRRLVRKYLCKSTLRAFKRAMLKYFGLKITQRSILKAVPVVSAVVGGAWNFAQVKVNGARVIAYFEGRAI